MSRKLVEEQMSLPHLDVILVIGLEARDSQAEIGCQKMNLTG
jgi:hypothetical protein